MISRAFLCVTLPVAACGADPSKGTASDTPKGRPAAASKGEAGAEALILEFPDGVRARRGKIQGQAKPWTSFTHAALLERIAACGAIDLRIVDGWSHRLNVVSRSTPRDRDVVRCVMRTLPYHFNAGVGSANVRELLRMDQTPFREFETASGRTG